MGHHKYNLKFSIKGQIIVAVILILTCSFFATVVTYFLIAVSMRPSNAAEKSASAVEKYISSQGVAVLNSTAQAKLQQFIKGSDIEYLVMDAKTHPLYGTLLETTITSPADLFRKLNVVSVERPGMIFGNTVDKVIPVLGKDGALAGAVVLKWDVLPVGMRGQNIWTRMVTFVFLLSPFVYMLFFTYVFARRVGKKLNRPLQALIEATRRIQHRDLDFSIDYQGKNEIGRVLDAFEDMRKDLKDALLVQWSLEAERREMLAAIAHDLRTPMTIIQGHAELLLENPGQSQDRLERYLETIMRNTNRVVRLMNDFRTVTDIDSPGFSLNPVQVDVEEYIRAKYNEFLVVTGSYGITLSLEYNDGRPHQNAMYIDTDRISQVIDNLMANALRFTPPGGQISWTVHVEDQILKVTIEDTGSGLPTNDVDRLFQKFYQGDKSRSGDKGHSGLGLYIVKVLVEKHGGSILAESNEQGGATFTFNVKPLKAGQC